MKLYLDTCSLQRPLDNKIQIQTILEAEALLAILAYLEADKLELVSSEVLLFEIRRIPNSTRQEYALEVLSKAKTYVYVDEQVESLAKQYLALGIQALDALHLASAKVGESDFFCTCDHRFLKKAKSISDKTPKVVSLLELIKDLGL